ncbi:MAG: hypothetical protein LBK93_01130 [Rickettsiales bacterium]|jgi:hypothetical protein|nr:hypothetical protein [Rickettsiales bacterium]
MAERTVEICKKCLKPLYRCDVTYEETRELYDANSKYNTALSMADPNKLYKDHSLNELELYTYFKASIDTLLETLLEKIRLDYKIVDKYTTNSTARVVFNMNQSKYQIEQCGE